MIWRKRPQDLSRDDAPEEAVLATVAMGLGAEETGVEFVYSSLDRLRARTGSEELVAILEDPRLGRQAFRAGRSPLDSVWARDLVMTGATGLHARPDCIEGPVGAAVLHLCAVALRLELALHDSHHDHLTGLLNRRAFDDLLAEACARSARYGWAVGLVLLDIDGFKGVNDRLGHPAGDAALQAVGVELRHHLRVGDAAARLGGDEFAVLFPNLRERSADELVARIERAIERAVPGADVTLSSGVALAPIDGESPIELYLSADQHLYEQKRRRP